MHIEVDFRTLKDMSTDNHIKSFLELISKHSITLTHADGFEPVKSIFSEDAFTRLWQRNNDEDKFEEKWILFRGIRSSKLNGIIIWSRNLPPGSKGENLIHFSIRIKANDETSWIVRMSDDLFIWSSAICGYISERKIDERLPWSGGIFNGLPMLKWVNYYSESYLQESSFHLETKYALVGRGARVMISDQADDIILSDIAVLRERQLLMGQEWFNDVQLHRRARLPALTCELVADGSVAETSRLSHINV
jgi:hypothetical protein